MAIARPLANPPVLEALFDIRFRIDNEVTLDAVRAVSEKLGDRFPQEGQTSTTDFQLDLGPEPAARLAPPGSRVEAILRRNGGSDGASTTEVIQLRRDGLSVSRLRPYTGWKQLEDLARDVFVLYVAAIKPTQVSRVAARFINRIDLPSGLVDLDHYLIGGPQVPKDAPQSIFYFQHRIGIVDDTRRLSAWLVTELAKDPDQRPSVVVDVDVFSTEPLPPRFDDLAGTYASVRDLKNSLFFGSITELAIERYA